MKSLFAFLIVSLLLVGSGCSESPKTGSSASADSTATAEDYYTCPMHPSVRSDRPGACPVCGMALVRKTALKEASSDELSTLARVSLSPTQRVIANVSTVRVRKSRISRTFTAAGIVDFAEPRRALVTARFRGRIEKLHVDFPGVEVRKGETLFELYSPDLVAAQQDYLLALQSRSEEPATQSLLTASSERLLTHFGMTADQLATIGREGKPRTTMSFAAPQAGTVLSKQVVEGQYVDEGTLLYEIADLSTVWIYFDVYEQDMRFIARGQDVSFTADSYPGERFAGRVTFVDPVMNPDTRTVRVRLEAPNRGGKLKPQMFVQATVSIALPQSLVVPRSALLSTGTRTIVWAETATNAFEPRIVTTGAGNAELVQVLEGLNEGESIAATGGYLIDSESNLQMPASRDVSHAEQGHTASRSARVEEFSIRVKGRYHPDTVRVSQGSLVRLSLTREEDSRCTEEIVFKDFDIRRTLPAWETTIVELRADKRGSFRFECGMNMVHGTLVVD